MNAEGDTVYERATAAVVVEGRPALADTLIAMNRTAIILGQAGIIDGFSTADTARLFVYVPKKGSVVIIFEHPITLGRALYVSPLVATEVTVGYRRQ